MVHVDETICSKCYLLVRRSTVREPIPEDDKVREAFTANARRVVHLRMPIRSVSYNPT